MLPAGAALDRILEHTGYLALAATTPGGVEAGDLLHAVDRVRQVLEDGGSLADAADALAADSEASNEVESLPLEPGRTDVVRLMNLHKAKGLEADVVFLADPCGGIASGWTSTSSATARRRSAGSRSRRSRESFARQAARRARRLGRSTRRRRSRTSTAEENRLLYVAATRAREMLVVSRSASSKGTPAWGVLNDCSRPRRKSCRVPHSREGGEPRSPRAAPTKAQAAALAARATARTTP